MSSFIGSDAICNIGVGFNLDNENPTLSHNSVLKKNDKMRKEEYFSAVFNAFENLIEMSLHSVCMARFVLLVI